MNTKKSLPWYLDEDCFDGIAIWITISLLLTATLTLMPPSFFYRTNDWKVTLILLSSFLTLNFSTMLFFGWLVPRLQRFALKRLRQTSLTLQRHSDIGTTTGPYRSLGAFTTAELVRWRIENDPDVSDDARRLADIEDRATTLEEALRRP
ncbi:MAG: hypothetical protein V1745_01505 [Patescibacteria group bacterium]